MSFVRSTIFGALATLVMVSTIPATFAKGNTHQFEITLEDVATPSVGVGVAKQEPLRIRPNKHNVIIKKHQYLPGEPQRLRKQQLSNQTLVVIGVDAKGKEVASQLIADPRLIRSESFDASGAIEKSDVFYRQSAGLTVNFVDDPQLATIKIYQPVWTGKRFDLELIGESNLK